MGVLALSYNKLWKLSVGKDMKKKDFQALPGTSSATITELGRNESVNTKIFQKICNVLKCDICDSLEFMSDEN